MYMVKMMLEDFKKSLIAKNRSKNTLETIKYTLDPAQQYFNRPLENLTIDHLKRYFEVLKEKGLSQNSIRLQQSIFSQFYDFCLNETDDEKYSILIRKLKRLKVDKEKSIINPSEILSPDEIKRLINVATLERDRCIIASLYESGMRIGELLSLTVDMVQMDEAKQEVTFNIPNIEGCKTGSRSVVCLEIYGYVQEWLKCNPSNKFIPLTTTGIRKAVKKLFTRASINKPCNLHHFRHSAITHAAGLNMSETQLSYRFWGIAHSTMVSVYIHLNEKIKASGYRDAKGMGENGKTIINPLSIRCVDCGRLIQTGTLCKSCSDSKKLSQENAALKARLDGIEKLLSSWKGDIISKSSVTFDDEGVTIKGTVNKDMSDDELQQLKRDMEGIVKKAEKQKVQ